MNSPLDRLLEWSRSRSLFTSSFLVYIIITTCLCVCVCVRIPIRFGVLFNTRRQMRNIWLKRKRERDFAIEQAKFAIHANQAIQLKMYKEDWNELNWTELTNVILPYSEDFERSFVVGGNIEYFNVKNENRHTPKRASLSLIDLNSSIPNTS